MRKSNHYTIPIVMVLTHMLTACDVQETESAAGGVSPSDAPPATPILDAASFIEEAESNLSAATIHAERNEWVFSNFITADTEALTGKSSQELTTQSVAYATAAANYHSVSSADLRRKLDLLKSSLVLPSPMDPAKANELSTLATSLNSFYGQGKYCADGEECKDLGDLSKIMASSTDEKELLDAWQGWRSVSPVMRPLYQRQTELANEGASDLGYADLGDLWRAKYDMPSSEFPRELDRLWGQIKPLYDALHCHVRAKLSEQYGQEVVPLDQEIPAHLLGNMWAQSWENIYDLVAAENSDPGYDLTSLLKEHQIDELKMVKSGENFFSSLGFDPLPESFWKRSLFLKPKDRSVVCHASAWDIDQKNDLRIKMCIQQTAEDFNTIHHELGHNYYQRAYNPLTFLYRNSANDGFHEAVGDTIALSVTPKYLQQIGLLDELPDPTGDIGLLMQKALEKIAFLPWGLMVDQWRWQVFSGEIKPENYNKAWWDLRSKYQGIRAPIARSESDFDPGAKYHVPANVPYTRYFLAAILQFQFHRSLCEIAGDKGPVHRCSIYNSKSAGKALSTMLSMGSSQTWPDALESMTGQREMDATAIIDYFNPLLEWLNKENSTRQCGW